VAPLEWLIVLLLAGSLPLIPAVMRPGRGRAVLAIGVGLLVLDLVMVAGTIWLLRGPR